MCRIINFATSAVAHFCLQYMSFKVIEVPVHKITQEGIRGGGAFEIGVHV